MVLDVSGMYSKMGSVVFALGAAAATFHTFNSMKDNTMKAWRQVCFDSVLTGVLVNCAVGLGAFIPQSPS